MAKIVYSVQDTQANHLHENIIELPSTPIWHRGGTLSYPDGVDPTGYRTAICKKFVNNCRYTLYSDGTQRWLRRVQRTKEELVGDRFIRTEFQPSQKWPQGGFMLVPKGIDRWNIRKKIYCEVTTSSKNMNYWVSYFSDGSESWMRYN